MDHLTQVADISPEIDARDVIARGWRPWPSRAALLCTGAFLVLRKKIRIGAVCVSCRYCTGYSTGTEFTETASRAFSARTSICATSCVSLCSCAECVVQCSIMALFQLTGATLAAWRTLTLYQSKDELAGARTGISLNSSVLHELQGRHKDVAGFWNSQAGQDCVIQGMFGRAEDGARPRYFVDLAANHAIHLSNTRALERDHGWHGVCIEGNEALAFELLRHRRCSVVSALAGADLDAKAIFRLQTDDGLSRMTDAGSTHATTLSASANARPVHTVPLADILEAAHAPHLIDYLSLDVEGSEERVLLRFPMGRPYHIMSMTIERPSAALRSQLAAWNYTHAFTSGVGLGDELYLSAAFPGGVEGALERGRVAAREWVTWYCSHGGYILVCRSPDSIARYLRKNYGIV